MSKAIREKAGGWKPHTVLGNMVSKGEITSLEEVFEQGLKIQESEIVDALIPDLQQELLNIHMVQKQTDAGEKTRFKSLVVVGNYEGYVGLGMGKAIQTRTAIEKGVVNAKINIVPIRRGCGGWECGCGEPHSLPFKVKGKCGSVIIELIPASKGLGIVGGEIAKKILAFAGIKDCWTRSFGSTRTIPSFAFAVYDALKNTYHIITPKDWAG